MTHKKDKDSQEAFEHRLEELLQLSKQRQQTYQQFVESIQNLKSLEKAEAWLEYIANDEKTYGAQEATVYLASRGYDCTEIVREMVAEWKLAEKKSIEDCMQEVRVYRFDTGEYGEVIKKGIPYTEASDILNQSPFVLRDFWGGFDHQEFSIDATMLRTVEWCNIGGFDEWWLRLAKEHYEMIIQGGVDPIPASFFLFNMCRSDYAIQLMQKTLTRMLEAIELPDHKQLYPWRRWRWTDPPQAVDHFAYAAGIAFVSTRLRPHNDTEVVNQSLEALLKNQDIEGSWHCWADDQEPSVDTTAMALHALALAKPRGWKLAASIARDWLWSIQDRSGCWHDRGCPDSVYLTVLVLDAIELAEGRSNITFDLSRLPAIDKRWPQSPDVEERLSEIKQTLDTEFANIKRGQAALYRLVGGIYRESLEKIRQLIELDRIEQGEMVRAVDTIRHALKWMQVEHIRLDAEVHELIEIAKTAVESELEVKQKLAVTLPILPLFLSYSVELAAGSRLDLNALVSEVRERWISLVARTRES